MQTFGFAYKYLICCERHADLLAAVTPKQSKRHDLKEEDGFLHRP